MTFSKTTWQTGDLITAALLNNTENQYDTYKTDWGYTVLTSGTTTDSVVYTDTSSYYIAAGAYNKLFEITLPRQYQSATNILIDFSVRTCSGSTGFFAQMYKLVPYSTAYVQVTVGSHGGVTNVTTAGISTNWTVTIKPWEPHIWMGYGGTGLTVIYNIRYYAVVGAATSNPSWHYLTT